MLISSFLVNNTQIMRLISRNSFRLSQCLVHTYSLNTREVYKDVIVRTRESFKYKEEVCGSVRNVSKPHVKFTSAVTESLPTRTLTTVKQDWKEQCCTPGVHASGEQNGRKSRRKWTYSSLLALSLFGTKSEGDEQKKESELIIMIKRGILALKNGELNKAEQLLHIALKTAQESNNQQAITYIFDLLANLAYQREEYSKAEKLFKDVLQRLLGGGMPQDDNAVVEISLKLASVYASMLDYEKAVQGFQFCIVTQEGKLGKYGEANLEEDTVYLWAMSNDWYARFLLNIDKFDLAKKHFLRAYDVSVKFIGPNHEQNAVLLNDIGSVCSLQKDYTEAIDYFHKAISVARESKSPEIGSFYVNLGTVYMQQNLLGEAERSCQEGLTLAKKATNKDAIEEAEICLSEIKKLRNAK